MKQLNNQKPQFVMLPKIWSTTGISFINYALETRLPICAVVIGSQTLNSQIQKNTSESAILFGLGGKIWV